MRRAVLALDLLLIFLFTAVLIAPLFHAKYLDRWDSIESTFIADGRFLHEHCLIRGGSRSGIAARATTICIRRSCVMGRRCCRSCSYR